MGLFRERKTPYFYPYSEVYFTLIFGDITALTLLNVGLR